MFHYKFQKKKYPCTFEKFFQFTLLSRFWRYELSISFCMFGEEDAFDSCVILFSCRCWLLLQKIGWVNFRHRYLILLFKDQTRVQRNSGGFNRFNTDAGTLQQGPIQARWIVVEKILKVIFYVWCLISKCCFFWFTLIKNEWILNIE